MSFNVISSGVTTGYNLSAFDSLTVLSGGTSLRSVVGDEAVEFVSSGGHSTSDTVLSGGTEYLQSGAKAAGVTVSSGGTVGLWAIVSSGQTFDVPAPALDATRKVSGVTFSAGANLDVIGAVVLSGATLSLASGASVADVTVSAGGALIGSGVLGVESYDLSSVAGLISGLTIGKLGDQVGDSWREDLTVLAGGAADGLTVDLGHLILSSGAVASGLDFAAGSDLLGDGNGSELIVSAGAAATGAQLGSGASATVFGRDNDTVISSGGVEFVESGGGVSGTHVLAGGVEVLSSGGHAAAGRVESGGLLDLAGVVVRSGQNFAVGAVSSAQQISGFAVASGGSVQLSDVTVRSGGVLSDRAGGVVSGGTIAGGGLISGQGLLAGAVENHAVVQGVQLDGQIDDFGQVDGVDVIERASAIGFINVESGAVAVDVTLDGGQLYVGSGGYASGALVNFGAVEVDAGGVASGVVLTDQVPNETIEEVRGSSFGTLVSSGASQYVSSGGLTSGAVILSGGAEILSSGASAAGVTVSSGGLLVFEAVVSSGQTLTLPGSRVISTAALDGVTVEAGGLVNVLGAHVLSGGTLQLQPGVVLGSLTVEAGAEETGTGVLAAFGDVLGQVSGLDVGDGGNHAGFLTIRSGGVASGVTVKGGWMDVEGLAVVVVVDAGAEAEVSGGGLASGATVSAGGLLEVFSDGNLAGWLRLGGKAVVDGTVAPGMVVLQGSSAILELGDLPDFHARISGLDAPGRKIDLDGFAFSSGETVSWAQSGAGGALSVTDGGKVATLKLVGTYATGDFQLGDDGQGGTFIGAPLATPPQLIKHIISSGVSAAGWFVSNGIDLVVLSGGFTDSSTVLSGGIETVRAGGLAESVLVAAGGSLVGTGALGGANTVYGTLSGVTEVASGLALGDFSVVVTSGGQMVNVTVGSGCQTLVVSDGSARGGVIYDSGLLMDNGRVSGVTASSGDLMVQRGGVARGDVIDAGGFEVIDWLGDAVSGFPGGSASGETINSGGVLRVSSGGIADATVVHNGGVETVFGGGRDVGTLLSGTEYDGGQASGTVVLSGGRESVAAGALSFRAVISAGGRVGVASGGVVAQATVSAGGTLVVSAGGAVSGGLALHDGKAVISGTMAAGEAVGFTGTSGTLELANLAGFHARISGLGTAQERVDLDGFGFSAGETVAWAQSGTSGTLTVQDGPQTARLTLIGAYRAGNFQLATDGHGGTFVSASAAAGGGAVPSALRFAEAVAGYHPGGRSGGAAPVVSGMTASTAASPIAAATISGR